MTAPPALSAVSDDRPARGQHGETPVKFPAKSPAAAQAKARRELREKLEQAFGGPGSTQQSIAAAGHRLTAKSKRQIINYLKEEADAPHWVLVLVTEYVIDKTERLARRIEG